MLWLLAVKKKKLQHLHQLLQLKLQQPHQQLLPMQLQQHLQLTLSQLMQHQQPMQLQQLMLSQLTQLQQNNQLIIERADRWSAFFMSASFAHAACR